ncbi:MAG: MFS transporter [Gammaproteobacteria bacterium]
MTPKERNTTLSLASIYAFRMLGLFMILPIFSLYTHSLQHATAGLIGLALGIYGLTQALLQTPFAMISDRIGRKPVIVFGLILFIVGSVVAAMSHTIDGIIIGRAIQGAGAIGSTLIALLADNTQEENRLKAMSVIGMVIGLSFVVSMVLGPILNSLVGLSGIFWLTAVLASLGIVILIWIVPTPKTHFLHRDSEPVLSEFKNVLTSPELLRLNAGIFSLHASLMALFLIIPMILITSSGLSENQQWILYLPILLIATVIMFPFVIVAETKRLMKPFFIGAIIVLTLTEVSLSFFTQHILMLSISLCLFFAAFTFLEACLPSLISKIVPAGSKGTAMGIYSSSQFLGIFVGGSVGGMLYHHFGVNSIFLFCGLLGLLWIILAMTMKQPPYLSSKIIAIRIEHNTDAINALQNKLMAINGIKEVMVSVDEQVAYLKVDKKELVADDLLAIIKLQ